MEIALLNDLITETELIPQERYATQRAKTPVLANLNKLHAKEVKRFFNFAPQLRMSWADYDEFIGRDNLCIYDLLFRAAYDGVFAFLLSREHASYTLYAAIGRLDSVKAAFAHEQGIITISLCARNHTDTRR